MLMSNTAQAATSTVAVGAATSPFWWSSLQQWSDTAALLLAPLGVLWLVIQITYRLYLWRREHNKHVVFMKGSSDD